MSLAGDLAVRWHLPPDLRKRLFDAALSLPLVQWLADGSATIVKDRSHRTIYRVQLPDLDFYLKEYRAAGLRNRLRELLRPVKAKSEFDKAEALAARGIAVPRPLGWGVLGSPMAPAASFLLSETVPGAGRLMDLNDPGAPSRQKLAQSLGEFFARLHAAGVIHRDIHPGNLLVHWSGDRPQLTLLDLHETHLHNNLSWRRCRDNLAIFNRYYSLRASRSDRLRFWRAYERAAGNAIPDHASATPAALEAATITSNQKLWRARFGKLHTGPMVRKFESGELEGMFVSGLNDKAAKAFASDPASMFNDLDVRMLKAGGRSTVALTRWGVIKRFNVRTPFEMVKNVIRQGPAARSWMMGHLLRGAALPTPAPLATAIRVRRWPAESYLLTEELKDAVDLKVMVDRLTVLPPTVGYRMMRDRIGVVARTLRQFHDRGFGHRDLKAPNILTPCDPEDHRIWFIDLAGVSWPRRNSRKRRVRDLGRLLASFLNHPGLSRGARLCFLLTYLGSGVRAKAGWRRWWRELGERGEAIVADIRARGRPVG